MLVGQASKACAPAALEPGLAAQALFAFHFETLRSRVGLTRYTHKINAQLKSRQLRREVMYKLILKKRR
jgi:hypothetical protein